MSMANVMADLRLSKDVYDALVSVLAEFADPTTPDDRAACVNDLSKILVDYGKTPALAKQYATVMTDVVEALAGGDDAVEHVMADIQSASPIPLDAAALGFIRDLLTRIEGAIRDYRKGKLSGN